MRLKNIIILKTLIRLIKIILIRFFYLLHTCLVHQYCCCSQFVHSVTLFVLNELNFILTDVQWIQIFLQLVILFVFFLFEPYLGRKETFLKRIHGHVTMCLTCQISLSTLIRIKLIQKLMFKCFNIQLVDLLYHSKGQNQ